MMVLKHNNIMTYSMHHILQISHKILCTIYCRFLIKIGQRSYLLTCLLTFLLNQQPLKERTLFDSLCNLNLPKIMLFITLASNHVITLTFVEPTIILLKGIPSPICFHEADANKVTMVLQNI